MTLCPLLYGAGPPAPWCWAVPPAIALLQPPVPVDSGWGPPVGIPGTSVRPIRLFQPRWVVAFLEGKASRWRPVRLARHSWLPRDVEPGEPGPVACVVRRPHPEGGVWGVAARASAQRRVVPTLLASTAAAAPSVPSSTARAAAPSVPTSPSSVPASLRRLGRTVTVWRVHARF